MAPSAARSVLLVQGIRAEGSDVPRLGHEENDCEYRKSCVLGLTRLHSSLSGWGRVSERPFKSLLLRLGEFKQMQLKRQHYFFFPSFGRMQEKFLGLGNRVSISDLVILLLGTLSRVGCEKDRHGILLRDHQGCYSEVQRRETPEAVTQRAGHDSHGA